MKTKIKKLYFKRNGYNGVFILISFPKNVAQVIYAINLNQLNEKEFCVSFYGMCSANYSYFKNTSNNYNEISKKEAVSFLKNKDKKSKWDKIWK